MTPTQIETMARRQYNAVGDTFYSSEEIMDYIYKAQMEFCKYTFMLKKTYETVTVAGQSEYPMPSNTISIKRIELNGEKVEPISFRENDDIVIANDPTTTLDYSGWYYEWGKSFFFSTTPATAGLTIKAFVYAMPQPVTITSTIEIPEEYHLDIVTFVNYMMAMKDENGAAAGNYQNTWLVALREARKLERRKLRGDSFASVQLEGVYGY